MTALLRIFFTLTVVALLPQIAGAAKGQETSQKKSSEIQKDEDLKSYLSGLQKKVVDIEEAEELSFGDRRDEAKESEIPLQLETSEKKSSVNFSPYQKILAVLGTVLLFGLVVFVMIHRSGKRGSLASGARNIKILSQKSIGPKRNLMVIKVAGESILLGVTDHNINFIKSLAILDDEMPALSPENFSTEMEKNMEPVEEQEFSEVVDGYAVSNLSEVKDVISKRYRA